MRTLLTGAAGQLGRSLRARLASAIALDRAQLDITSYDAVRAAIGGHCPDVVINCAAYNAVDAAESDVVGAFRGNAVGPRNLAVACAAAGIPLVHVSTDYVFDGEAGRAYHEFDRPNPRSVYGASKLAGEETVRDLNPKHYVVRTAWVYHAGGHNFPNTILGLAKKGPVRVVDDQHGSPTYAPHLAEAILRLVETGAYGTYHLAGRGGASWYELTRRLFELMQVEARVDPVATAEFPRPAKRPAFGVLTTVQNPEILLPAWEEGVAEFARCLQEGRVD
jgi:dTDP-4-dehydrorhamnose reductase